MVFSPDGVVLPCVERSGRALAEPSLETPSTGPASDVAETCTTNCRVRSTFGGVVVSLLCYV